MKNGLQRGARQALVSGCIESIAVPTCRGEASDVDGYTTRQRMALIIAQYNAFHRIVLILFIWLKTRWFQSRYVV